MIILLIVLLIILCWLYIECNKEDEHQRARNIEAHRKYREKQQRPKTYFVRRVT